MAAMLSSPAVRIHRLEQEILHVDKPGGDLVRGHLLKPSKRPELSD
jgi:hypothetical protein